MNYFNLKQKYSGLTARAVDFLTKNQLSDRDMWRRFVDQFRRPIDGVNNGWRGEYWGKMMRGAVLVYEYSRDAELFCILTETVRDMISVIAPDGRISSFTKDTEFRAWDLWCRKYVILGLEYYLDICSDDALKSEIIAAISRAADYIIAHIGKEAGKIHINKATKHWLGLNSSSILEPMVRLYNLTGAQKYLDFAAYIVESGGSEINVFELGYDMLYLPLDCKVLSAKALEDGKELKFQRVKGGILLEVGKVEDKADYVVELITK